MPRRSRIDAPGALHHIISRGIERCVIFQDDADYSNFLDRFGAILQETDTRCFAWALISNHFHLLLKTGLVPISTVMRRLLTGYVVVYNRRHRRCGHLFQNRYKSILCEEDAYLLELVRYIHLNPVRAKIIEDIEALDRYPYTGHSALMGKVKRIWQDTDWVLKLFGDRTGSARRNYRNFVRGAISQGRRDDLTGGGLIRSAGGWAAAAALRKDKIFHKFDERILGSGDFAEYILSAAQEKMEEKYRLAAQGYDMDKVAARVSELLGIKPTEIWKLGKERRRVEARSLLCYWAIRELGISMAELSRRLKLSIAGVSLSVKRGEIIVQDRGYSLVG